jgi:MFS family permease
MFYMTSNYLENLSSRPDMTDASTVSWAGLFDRRYGARTTMLGLGVILAAVEGLVVTTALPSAAGEIGGLTFYSWATTLYMVGSILSAASGGLIKSRYGARRGFIGAALVFVAGTIMCGLAPTMAVLLVGRAVQGLGGGLILALCYAIVRDSYPETLWPKAFALMSGVWGTAALLGPLMGGVFASMGYWRLSFLSMVPIAIFVAVLAFVLLPKAVPANGDAPYPIGRLALLGAAILAVAMAGNIGTLFGSVCLIGGALIAMMIALRLDDRAADRMLPRAPFSPSNPVGAGLWIVLVMSASICSFGIYGPLLLQMLHGVSPLMAGYIVAAESVSWTAAALFTASLAPSRTPITIIAGPVITTFGLIGLALFVAAGPMSLIILSVFLSGAGIGACWAFVSDAILRGATDDDGDLAGSSIPTVQTAGYALGSALAGIIANGVGIAEGMSVETTKDIAVWVHVGFVAPAIVATAMAVRLVQLGRRVTVQ